MLICTDGTRLDENKTPAYLAELIRVLSLTRIGIAVKLLLVYFFEEDSVV
jgi:hypothetical protein